MKPSLPPPHRHHLPATPTGRLVDDRHVHDLPRQHHDLPGQHGKEPVFNETAVFLYTFKI